jgi:hypothetical protein
MSYIKVNLYNLIHISWHNQNSKANTNNFYTSKLEHSFLDAKNWVLPIKSPQPSCGLVCVYIYIYIYKIKKWKKEEEEKKNITSTRREHKNLYIWFGMKEIHWKNRVKKVDKSTQNSKSQYTRYRTRSLIRYIKGEEKHQSSSLPYLFIYIYIQNFFSLICHLNRAM